MWFHNMQLSRHVLLHKKQKAACGPSCGRKINPLDPPGPAPANISPAENRKPLWGDYFNATEGFACSGSQLKVHFGLPQGVYYIIIYNI